jgi:quercetin dioxygenase-like cupin family protein
VRIIALGKERGTPLVGDGTTGASWVGLCRTENAGSAQLGVVHLGAGGRLGRREAVVPQFFLVVAGDGWVADGAGDRHRLRPGEAAHVGVGELYEIGTDTGLTAIVLEAEELPLVVKALDRVPSPRVAG